MAKKPINPLEDPPTASSSEDDEVESSAGEEEEDSSSEEEEPKDSVKPPSAAVTIAVPGKTTVSAANSSAVKRASDSESGSETETDSDSETERPSNPGSGKSVAVTVAIPKKKEAAQPAPALALPAAKSGTKRPSEGTSRDTNAKRAKKVTSGEEEKKIGEDIKKPAFQRLWSEEDEITVLQGMIDFKADTGKSPYEDSNGFYDFIKKSISFEVSKNQFMDKIRSLKKKYMGKGKNGVEPSFLKPHDQKSYELSKFIWGPEGMALESVVKSNGVSNKRQKTKKLDSVKQELTFVASPNGKKVEDDKKVLVHGADVEPVVTVRKPDWFETSFLVRSIAGFGVDEHEVKQGWSLVSVENKKKIEEKVKALQAKEWEFVLEKTGFLHEVASMINEAKKKPLDI